MSSKMSPLPPFLRANMSCHRDSLLIYAYTFSNPWEKWIRKTKLVKTSLKKEVGIGAGNWSVDVLKMFRDSHVNKIEEIYDDGFKLGGCTPARHTLLGPIDPYLRDVEKDAVKDLPLFTPRHLNVMFADTADTYNIALNTLQKEIEGGDCLCGFYSRTNKPKKEPIMVLGFDTETKPKFHKGGQSNLISLIQLSTLKTAYVFRVSEPYYLRASKQIRTLLNIIGNPDIMKVGVGISQDEVHMKKRFPGFCTSGSFIDLEDMIRIRWPQLNRCGLRYATASILSYNLSKKQQMKNWEMERYTDKMIFYAAYDAFIGIKLWEAVIDVPSEVNHGTPITDLELLQNINDKTNPSNSANSATKKADLRNKTNPSNSANSATKKADLSMKGKHKMRTTTNPNPYSRYSRYSSPNPKCKQSLISNANKTRETKPKCKVCDLEFNSMLQFSEHIKGKKHKNKLKYAPDFNQVKVK